MPYYAIFDSTTGKLLSLASRLPETLADGVSSKNIGNPPRRNQMWDEAKRTYVGRPAKVVIDRLDRKKNGTKPKDIAFQSVFNQLRPADKAVINEALREAYENSRYASEEDYAKDDD